MCGAEQKRPGKVPQGQRPEGVPQRSHRLMSPPELAGALSALLVSSAGSEWLLSGPKGTQPTRSPSLSLSTGLG